MLIVKLSQTFHFNLYSMLILLMLFFKIKTCTLLMMLVVARPKSPILTWSLESKNMFTGFKSLWIIPCGSKKGFHTEYKTENTLKGGSKILTFYTFFPGITVILEKTSFFFFFRNHILKLKSLLRGCSPFHLDNVNHFYVEMICEKFGWKFGDGSLKKLKISKFI